MSPTALFAMLLCIWAITNYWLFPLGQAHWKSADARQKLVKAGALVVLQKVRDLAGIGALATGAVVVAVWIAERLSGSSAVAPAALLAAMQSVYQIAKGWSERLGGVAGVLSLAAAVVALYYAAKYAKQRVSDAWLAKTEEVYARVQADASAELAKGRDDAELRPWVEQIDELVQLLIDNDAARAEAEKVDASSASLLPPEAIAAINKELSQRLMKLSVEMARKELKLEEALRVSREESAQQPTSRLLRWFRIVTSASFGKDLGLISKSLSRVVTALLFVSLVGWAAAPLAEGLQVALNRLQVNAVAQQAEADVQAAFAQKDQPLESSQETADDEGSAGSTVRVTTMLAREVAAAALRSPLTEGGAIGPRHQRDAAEFVRAALTEQRIDGRADATDVGGVRKETADRMAAGSAGSSGSDNLTQSIEKELQPLVEKLKQEKPGRYAALVAKLKGRYTAGVLPLDAQGQLIARMADEVAGTVDLKPEGELAKQAQKLVKEFGKEAFKTWLSALTKAYVAAAIIDPARVDVETKAAARFGFESSSTVREFMRDLEAAQGTGWTSAGRAAEEARVAEAVAGHLRSSIGGGDVNDMLGSFERLFPNGSRGGGSSSRSSDGKPFLQARATDFHLASRSFRVRGVIIGRDTSSKPLELSNLRWKISPAKAGASTQVALEVLSSTAWMSVGTFDAAVVNQSLRYAADRRVVATTIGPGDRSTVRRVTYLHPALIDTPLGCRIVEADRFIDAFSSSPVKPPASSSVEALRLDRREIWRWMETVELAQAVAIAPASESCPTAEIDDLIRKQPEIFKPVRFTPATAASIDGFIATAERNRSGSGAFLQQATTCARGHELAKCLCSQVQRLAPSARYWYPEDHTSQIRERTAELTADFAWTKPSPDRLEHLDLWVHTTLSLREARGQDSAPLGDEETATPIDFAPTHIAALRERTRDQLPAYLSTQLGSPTYDDFMAPIEQFVVLQRFARAALAGRLGPSFPLQRLIDLERDTRAFVPYQTTIRWEPMPGREQALMALLGKADPAALESYQRWRKDRVAADAREKPTCDRVSK